MGALKRAARYLARKPGKAALLVVVVFATSLAVMASVGIIEGARDLSHAIKEGSRPSVAVYREDGELLPFVVAGDLSNREDVASANRTGQVDAFPASFSSIEAAVPCARRPVAGKSLRRPASPLGGGPARRARG